MKQATRTRATPQITDRTSQRCDTNQLELTLFDTMFSHAVRIGVNSQDPYGVQNNRPAFVADVIREWQRTNTNN